MVVHQRSVYRAQVQLAEADREGTVCIFAAGALPATVEVLDIQLQGIQAFIKLALTSQHLVSPTATDQLLVDLYNALLNIQVGDVNTAQQMSLAQFTAKYYQS